MKPTPVRIAGLGLIGYGIYRLARGPQTLLGVTAKEDVIAPWLIMGAGLLLALWG